MKRIVVLRFPPKIIDVVREDLSGFVLCHLSTPNTLLMGDRKQKSPARDGYPSRPRMQAATALRGNRCARSWIGWNGARLMSDHPRSDENGSLPRPNTHGAIGIGCCHLFKRVLCFVVPEGVQERDGPIEIRLDLRFTLSLERHGPE